MSIVKTGIQTSIVKGGLDQEDNRKVSEEDLGCQELNGTEDELKIEYGNRRT